MDDKIAGLRKRIRVYILDVIKFVKEVTKDEVGRVFVNQIIRSVTSIGANFEEATEAQSTNDLIHKLSIAKKETKETGYWLELICETWPELAVNAKLLINENDQLVRIFSSIIYKKKNKFEN